MSARDNLPPHLRPMHKFTPPAQAQARENRDLDRQIALLERQQAAARAREGLLPYIRFTMPDPEAPNDATKSRYEDEEFHRQVADVLTRFLDGELLLDSGDPCYQLIFCMPPRHGKSCADDTPVPTPSGWRLHGDLRVGDFVFGPDGQPTRVIGLNPKVREVVPVTLTNGEVIEVHPNHEWRVYDRACRAWRVMETKEIARRALRVGSPGRGGRYVLQLPDVAALEFPKAVQPLHPYVLGAWLGDGSTGSTRIAHAPRDADVVDTIEALGYPKSGYFVQEGTGVGYTSFSGTVGVGSEMQKLLKTLGVLWDKHIPEQYQIASVTQRLELLAGLVDTDGHVCRRTGRVRFSTCSEKLRDGVFQLTAGLGFRPRVTAVPPRVSSSGIVGRKTTYQVCFQPNRQLPTQIPRKRVTRFAKRRAVAIASVGRPVAKPARSISVAREDGLYVVGRHCVATKNTEAATKRLTAYASGLHPDWDIAVASYSDTMAQDMGADTRAILASPQHKQVFPNYRLRRGGNAKDNIQTDRGGRIVFVGRGGALTGRGMHLGLGDDLFKDHEEARSQAIRDQAWNWFTKVFMTRRMGRKMVILTMTRWHSDDIIGRITDPENPHYNAIEAKKWKIIRLPAIAEDDDPLGRAVGAPLWPARYGLDFLESQRRLDPLGFEALYQQRPTVADGVLFRRENIRFYKPDQLPTALRFYASSDHAVGTAQRNDPTVLLKAGVDPNDDIYLTDCFWQRVPSDQAVEAMLAMGGGSKRPLIWWAERGHISKSIGPFLRKRMLETGTFINVVEVTPATDKEQRAQSIAARVAMGKVYFPIGAPWTERAVNEMLAFPNGTHDDFVDALAYIGLGLRSQVRASTPREQTKVPAFGTLAWVKWTEKWQKQEDERKSAGGF